MSDLTEAEKARINLKRSGIKAKVDSGGIDFSIPKHIADKLKKEFNFTENMLKVGGGISLFELAAHIDEQPTLEAWVSAVTEQAKYELEQAKIEFEQWHDVTYYKVRESLSDVKTITETYLRSYIAKKYSKVVMEHKQNIAKLEYTYRLLNNAMRAPILTKGQLLQTLKGIVMGNGANQPGAGSSQHDKSRTFSKKRNPNK